MLRKCFIISGLFALLVPLILGGIFQTPSALAEEPDAGHKISSLLALQVDAKTSAVETGGLQAELDTSLREGRVDILYGMQATGMDVENLNKQRIFIHLAEEPTAAQVEELEASGITLYLDSWIPPVGAHPTGFVIADMPINKLEELAAKNYVVRLDTAERVLEPQNDLATQKINADDVWDSGYDGAGVKIAVLDSGFDTNHPDIPPPVASKDYSNWPALDDTIANQVTGHGTHVAGSALGRGTQSGGVYRGSAPGADLIFLKIGNDTTGNASLDAGVNAIKDAVDVYGADIITRSYGGWGTYHDGTSQIAQAVDYAVSQGALVFNSAGNSANDDQHYSGTVDTGSTTDFIQVDITGDVGTNTALIFNLVWYDGIGTSNDLELEYYDSGHTPMSSLNELQTESPRGTESEYSGYDDYLFNGTYYLKVKNNSANSQFFHIYYDGMFNRSGAGNVKFDDPDPFYTIGTPADADGAIAVGAYTTRKYWQNYEGVTYWYSSEETVDTITSFSSRGPRVDNGIIPKPNVVAPGSAIISVRDTDIYTWPGIDDPAIIDNDGLNLNGSGPADYFVMHGTSMASPHAAGAAALLLQACPALKGDPSAVRDLLQDTASNGGVHDDTSGYGLIDIQAAIQAAPSEPPGECHINYQAHVQSIGWQDWVSDGATAGTSGQCLGLEAIKIEAPGYSVEYQGHVQSMGWQDWVCDGALAGTTGQSLRLEAVRIRLNGAPSDLHVYYRAHVQNIGWQDWVQDGALAGTSGQSLQVEAIEIQLQPPDEYDEYHINYQAHVQNIGWQDWVSDGATAGTSGQCLGLEAIKIEAPGYSVEYQGHVQNIGWQDWVCDGALSGTIGQSLRLEAVRIRLNGAPPDLHVYYRAHVQNIGWQDWVQDGALAGTSGQSLQVEAIEIRLETGP